MSNDTKNKRNYIIVIYKTLYFILIYNEQDYYDLKNNNESTTNKETQRLATYLHCIL